MIREEAKEFIAQSVKSDVDMALVADALKTLGQEPKIGHKVSGDLLGGLYCSECMTYVNEYFNYCPHCGAKMESEE